MTGINFSKVVVLQNGVQVLNCTPHVLIFRAEDGTEVSVAPCGATLLASAVETPAGNHGKAQLVRTAFQTSPDGLAELAQIKTEAPDTLVIGSIISAQAYAGEVVSPVNAKGFERVPPAEKRMDPNKFNTFGASKTTSEALQAFAELIHKSAGHVLGVMVEGTKATVYTTDGSGVELTISSAAIRPS